VGTGRPFQRGDSNDFPSVARRLVSPRSLSRQYSGPNLQSVYYSAPKKCITGKLLGTQKSAKSQSSEPDWLIIFPCVYLAHSPPETFFGVSRELFRSPVWILARIPRTARHKFLASAIPGECGVRSQSNTFGVVRAGTSLPAG